MAGMNSEKLSQRARQPGHDQTFRESESNFIEALEAILDLREFAVDDKPNDLLRMLGGHYGIQPEASIEHLPSGRKMYFEVKKQGPAGNADERACKHHTVQFYNALSEFTGYDYHAFCTIMCESLAELPKYTTKHAYFFEPEHYFAWKDYDLDLLADYIALVCDRFLLHGGAGMQEVPD